LCGRTHNFDPRRPPDPRRSTSRSARIFLDPRRTAIGTADTNTAILFFSRRPEREGLNKRFVRQDYAQNRRVAQAFYDHARQAVAESGLPVVEVDETQQRGPDFGTRLANAFADVFEAGYDRVIAVGNDCPTLHEVDWSAVTDQLAAGRPVLGPTPDQEGAYLIGLTRAQFDRASFAALPWRSPALIPALRSHLNVAAGTRPAQLMPRADVNGHGELMHLLREASAPPALADRLRQVLGGASWTQHAEQRGATRPVLERRSRAPPISRRNSHA
jgi:glycosyltransferase A (GT-A) superfamily protein (DUF2064 family)